MINDTRLRVRPSKPAEHDLRNAWIAVALLPVGFVVAMFVGDGLIGALGYDTGESVPVGPARGLGLPSTSWRSWSDAEVPTRAESRLAFPLAAARTGWRSLPVRRRRRSVDGAGARWTRRTRDIHRTSLQRD